MRKILFRGKRKDNGEWVIGCYVRVGKSCYIFSGKLDITITKGHVDFERYEVIPETVGQYIGLEDENDKAIFEGDIISVNDKLFEVFFSKGNFLMCSERFNLLCNCREIRPTPKTVIGKVIGNIHDNPELLEVKE